MTFQNMIAECDTPTTEEAPPNGNGDGMAPILPPIEESERRPRRRRASHLKTTVTDVWAFGREWKQQSAIAKSGFKIMEVQILRPCDGEGAPSVRILTKRTGKQAEQEGDE
jgi:hypothetical protein